MKSTPNNSLGVLSGIAPLQSRIQYLNFRYFIAAFGKLGHLLKEKLIILNSLNPQRTIKSFETVIQYNILQSESYTKFDLKALLCEPEIDKTVELALSKIDESLYHVVAPRQQVSLLTFHRRIFTTLTVHLSKKKPDFAYINRLTIMSDTG